MSGATPIERVLGYDFSDPGLLVRALTHRSKAAAHNERLEFLGDSVLNLIASRFLYDRFGEVAEGDLTRLRAAMVRRESLARAARAVGLGQHLSLGAGELKSGGFDRDSILADGMEAMIGAIYLDGGFDAARDVVLRTFEPVISGLDPDSDLKDPKTRLQEFLQKRGLPTPEYSVETVTGRAHDQHFVASCRIQTIPAPVQGEGANRRAAEQDAAARAYTLLRDQIS